MSGHVAIFDVGKSNKKVVLFDEGMQQVAAEYQAFPALEEGAEHYEQTAAVTEWFLQTLRNLAAEHSIEAVGITTHGACAAGVDADGGLVEPVYAYTTDPGADFHADFHARCGTPRDLHRELASPSLAGSLLNLGVAAHYVQERHPEQWRQIRWFLPYPQYFAHVLTGKAAAEPTMLACHAYLYDFATGTYSRIPRELGLMDRLPDIVPSGQVIGGVSPAVAAATGLAAGTPVIAGVHDSNASLIPYLMLQDGRFILNSSGTWCVLMKPGSDRQLDDAQMDRNVFCNCSVFGDPVKTALVMAGQERQSWAEALSARQPGRDIYPDYDEVMHADLIADGERFVLP
ncbi:MAG: FGGY family carbohydrate kinase, partial [Planctomycetota bacterium]